MSPETFELEKHYGQVVEWWQGHQWPVVPPAVLPKTGLIVPGFAAGFLYKTDSNLAWLEWAVVNPQSDRILRREALDAVLGGLFEEAKKAGFEAVFTSVSHPGLIERYKKLGFSVSDTGMTNLARRV